MAYGRNYSVAKILKLAKERLAEEEEKKEQYIDYMAEKLYKIANSGEIDIPRRVIRAHDEYEGIKQHFQITAFEKFITRLEHLADETVQLGDEEENLLRMR